MSSAGYDNPAGDFHKLSGVAEQSFLHRMMSCLNITMLMIDFFLDYHEHHLTKLGDNADTM
jgi:hypothetical protein